MAAVEVRIPTILQKIAGSPRIIQASGDTVGQVLIELEKNFPGLKGRITDLEGKLNSFIIVFVNDRDIRYKKNLDTQLSDGDVLSILPAIGGGTYVY